MFQVVSGVVVGILALMCLWGAVKDLRSPWSKPVWPHLLLLLIGLLFTVVAILLLSGPVT